LAVPEEEAGFDDPMDVTEIEKDIETMAENASYKLMKKSTIKITVNNKKKRLAIDNGEEEAAEALLKRSISVEAKDHTDDW